MKKLIFSIGLLLAISSAFAQVASPATRTPLANASYTMPAGKLYIDLATVPNGSVGSSTLNFGVSCDYAGCETSGLAPNRYASASMGGAFRIGCGFSHMAFDDPIVWPGGPGKTHLHTFFGNSSTSSASDVELMATVGKSTCAGGTINRSGYWVPPIVDVRTGTVQRPTSNNVYYKTCCDFSGIGNPALVTSMANQLRDLIWAPVGLRILTGNPNNTTGGIPGRFDCVGYAGNRSFPFMPTSAEAKALPVGTCEEILMLVFFQACWDGVNLDAADHASHIGPVNFYEGCTNPLYPKMFVAPSYNVHYKINNLDDLDYWRLTSDQPASSGFPAGHSLHADWINGWNTAPIINGKSAQQLILDQCLKWGVTHPGQTSDCHNSLLGNPNPALPGTFYTLQ